MKNVHFNSIKFVVVLLVFGAIAFMFYGWYSSSTIEFQKLAVITGKVDEVRLEHTKTAEILNFTVQSDYALESFRCHSDQIQSYGEVAELLVKGNEISVWYSPEEKVHHIWQLEIWQSWPQKRVKVSYEEMRKEYQQSATSLFTIGLTFLAACAFIVFHLLGIVNE
jgi:hypothetical protein